jgi:hypothetical protein
MSTAIALCSEPLVGDGQGPSGGWLALALAGSTEPLAAALCKITVLWLAPGRACNEEEANWTPSDPTPTFATACL